MEDKENMECKENMELKENIELKENVEDKGKLENEKNKEGEESLDLTGIASVDGETLVIKDGAKYDPKTGTLIIEKNNDTEKMNDEKKNDAE